MAQSASKWSAMERGICTYTSKPSAYAGSQKIGACVTTYTRIPLTSEIRLVKNKRRVFIEP